MNRLDALAIPPISKLPETDALPLTSSLVVGATVPIPTFPVARDQMFDEPEAQPRLELMYLSWLMREPLALAVRDEESNAEEAMDA